jgi:hypothetical protein
MQIHSQLKNQFGHSRLFNYLFQTKEMQIMLSFKKIYIYIDR